MHGYKMKIRRMRSQDREWGHAGGETAAAAAAAAARPQKILCMVHGTAVQLYSCTAMLPAYSCMAVNFDRVVSIDSTFS